MQKLLTKNIKITPKGAKLLRAMIVSCGNPDCFDAVALLDGVKENQSYLEIALKKDNSWSMAAFERLFSFAAEKKAKIIDLDLVAWYFGGTNHIEIMYRYGGHAGLGVYLGPDAGLVTHTLLPLNNKFQYKNENYKISFKNFVDVGGRGEPFYHLGIVVRAPVSKKTIDLIKKEQIKNSHFKNSLGKISDEIVVPQEYLMALNCTTQKTMLKKKPRTDFGAGPAGAS